ncbi:hypothetical protein ACIRO3_34565 [Streptomyces sp. NPDC102278]|uniref:hypothetical protein n=1 Tax=Streptomyces sp. NPDC102278 TaxID=3366152 RepID=UPI0038287AF1
MTDRPPQGIGTPPTGTSTRRRRGRRCSNAFTALAVVASFASLFFSWQGVEAQQLQTERLDQEVVFAVVSKVGWWYDLDAEGVATRLWIENRSLSAVYNVRFDLVDSGGAIVRSGAVGDLMACKRADLEVAAIQEINKQPTMHAELSLTDHRGHSWKLNHQRTIGRISERADYTNTAGLSDKQFRYAAIEACG